MAIGRLMLRPSPRAGAVAVLLWGLISICVAAAALLVPEQMVVTHSPGPRTPTGALVLGALFLVLGTAVTIEGIIRFIRTRDPQDRTTPPVGR